ncbi:MAG: M15 family metallopeptidase [Bacilli bacterium]|nr:M15 family metallopeptidase [Bacilli bacterium]
MNEKKFRYAIYIVLAILILLFYTKDIDLFGQNFYENIKQIDNPDAIMVLVNKNYQLNNNYVPNDLEIISTSYAYENKSLRKEAKEAFEQLSEDAKNLGYKIVATSAYRDYDYQKKLFEEYTNEKGEAYALECSAKPGHSEHQTGLAVDVAGSNDDYDEFESSIEFPWLKENAHLYGFILRYPKGKEHITGFKYEPWHYRYVGMEVATIIYNENLTLEEYYNKYL